MTRAIAFVKGPPGHHVEVVPDGHGYRARCVCGWGGALKRNDHQAIRSMAMHCAREDARQKLGRSS